MKQNPIIIDGSSLSLATIELIANGAPLHIPQSVHKRIRASQEFVKKASNDAAPIYGVNTGFGYFAFTKISAKELQTLQTNLIKSHAAGYGNPLTLPETRLAMSLRLNVLVKGLTGVRWELCQALLKLIQAGIYPIIPEYGSVGASGDLAPLAHLALPLIGEGNVVYQNTLMPAAKALKLAHLKPLKLDVKEGLGLINGTQIMLSVGGLALASALRMIQTNTTITALTYEALSASLNPLNPLIHSVRGQIGQIQIARAIRKELIGSYLHSPNLERINIQDSYSLRCAPQVIGASLDALNYAQKIIDIELNAATDNPLIFEEEHKILSGGNFHGQPLALAFDFAAIAVAELGNISDRRLELLMNPHTSHLPPFLATQPGLCSGYMALQYLSASLVNENKILANPASTDSIPGNVGIEDHVSMGMTSARKLKKIVQNTRTILSLEALAAAQAIDLRELKKLGRGSSKLYKSLRKKVPFLNQDRIISEDVNQAVEVIHNFEYQ